MLSLDPEVAAVAKSYITDLRVAKGLQYKPILKNEDTMGIDEAAEYSVISHLNISRAKWDICLPWSEKLHFAINDDELV